MGITTTGDALRRLHPNVPSGGRIRRTRCVVVGIKTFGNELDNIGNRMNVDEAPAPASPAPVGRGPSPRPSVALGLAVRRARTGRYTLAQLSQRSGVSAGLLSLIERGRGNPSINTLGSIAEALGVSLPELVADAIDSSAGQNALVATLRSAPEDVVESWAAPEATGGDSALPAKESRRGMRTSMVLQGGQEARVRVLDGTLELTLHDRTAEFGAGSSWERALSVDLSLRTATSTAALQIPPVEDPRWLDFARGAVAFEPTSLACQMLFTHVVRCVREDPSSPNVDRWVRELRGFFVKYESVWGRAGPDLRLARWSSGACFRSRAQPSY